MLRLAGRVATRRINVLTKPLLNCHYATGSVKSFFPTPRTESNIKTETNKLSRTLERFWEKVDIIVSDAGEYQVQLDGKTIKTPQGFTLTLPEVKKHLAYLIKHEWSNLPDLKIKTHSLPLTSIVSRAIDLTNCDQQDPEQVARIGRLDDIRYNLIKYFDTDTCLIFTLEKEYEGKLRSKQNELYLPLIKEHEEFFTVYGKKHGLVEEDVKITTLDCETDGLRGSEQSITTQNVVLHWLENLPLFDLVALEKAVLTSKSFLVGVSLLRSNSSDEEVIKNLYQVNKNGVDDYFFKTVEELVELGNLEIIFQTEEWGEVEDTHDVDKEDWLRNLASAALLCQ